jgi:uncharacterized delta-60 repeat protein
MVTTDLTASTEDLHEAFAMVLQPDGRVVVAGRTGAGSNFDFVLARYDTAGQLDATFGTGGIVTTDFTGIRDEAQSIILQPDGKILVAGQIRDASSYFAFALARYHDDGSPDREFGVEGNRQGHHGLRTRHRI